MDYLPELMPALVPSLAWALIDFAWQGALVACAAALLLALMRGARPQLRYLVLCVALLACLALPAAGVAVRLLEAADAGPVTTTTLAAFVVPAAPIDAPSGALLPVVGAGWHAALQANLPLVTQAWALGVALFALRMLMGLAGVRSHSREAAARGDPALARCVQRLARRFGIRRPVRLGCVEGIDSPLTAGWWRPVVLVPAALAARMPPDLLEALLAHELAHIRRHDYLVNLVQGAIEIVLFYHPATWWLSARIRHEREQVADDLAASVLGEPRRLALALSELDRVRLVQPQLAPAANGGHLMSRIKRLVRPTREPLNWKIAVPILGLAAACAGLYANAAQPPKPAAAAPAAPAVTAAQPAPAAARAAPRARQRASGEGYAIVRATDKGNHITVNGSDRADIDAAKSGIKGDFIWFRRGGQAYVIDDPALVAKAAQAWAPMDALGKEMDAHGRKMGEHGKTMEALGQKMATAAAARAEPTRKQALAFQERIHALAMQRVALAMDAAAAQRDIDAAEGVDRTQQRARLDAVRAKEEAIEAQIDAESAAFEALHAMDEAAMEAVGRDMEKAGEPMEALGAEMEALGERMKAEGEIADKATRALIERALEGGKARPAPRG